MAVRGQACDHPVARGRELVHGVEVAGVDLLVEAPDQRLVALLGRHRFEPPKRLGEAPTALPERKASQRARPKGGAPARPALTGRCRPEATAQACAGSSISLAARLTSTFPPFTSVRTSSMSLI